MQRMLPVFLCLVLGCASTFRRPDDQLWSNSAQVQGDPRIGEFISSQWSFNTSSYWIEGPEGLVLIDTQFVPSAVRKEINFAERTTGKKVKLAIILHPNPDRFDGTGYVKNLGVPVVTSEQVRDLIPGVHQKWAPILFEKYAVSQYQRELVLPEAFGSSTRELTAGGVTVKAHVLGVGCSGAHVAVEWEGHLFVGDLVASGAHSWFENGRTDEWLKRLDEVRALQPKWIHPGHGLPGGPELLDRQTEYLKAVVAAVAEERPRGLASSDALARITEKVTQRYPDRNYPFLLQMFLPAEWARQAAASVAHSSPPP